MAKQDKMDGNTVLAFTMMGVFSAVGLLVVLNGGHVLIVIALLLAAAACGAYVVNKAIKRYR